MHLRTIALALGLTGIMLGCSERPTAPTGLDPTDAPLLAKRTSSTTSTRYPYTLQFGGDIVSGAVPNVMLDPARLLGDVSHTPIAFTLPPLELGGCGATGGSWGEYAGLWSGPAGSSFLFISQSAGTTTLHLKIHLPDGKSFWLTSEDGTTTTSAAGTVTMTFSDAFSYVRYSDWSGEELRPCASFTLTAVRQ